MKEDSIDADRAWLESLGFESDLTDSPSGTRMIQVLFADGIEEDDAPDELAAADRGFACVA